VKTLAAFVPFCLFEDTNLYEVLLQTWTHDRQIARDDSMFLSAVAKRDEAALERSHLIYREAVLIGPGCERVHFDCLEHFLQDRITSGAKEDFDLDTGIAEYRKIYSWLLLTPECFGSDES
jgi:hypothetical protein